MADKDKIQIPEVVMPTGNFERALDRLNERIDETGQTFSNMAERIEKDAAVKIKHSVDSIVKSIDKMASGNNMTKYWKSQDALVEDLTKTYNKLDSAVDVLERRNLSQELYKTFNALKAVSGANFSNLQDLEILKKASEWINKANYRDAFKTEFNSTAFREMFDVFEQMENSGANVQRVFDAINKGTQFDSVSRELRDVKNQLENIASADLTEIQNKLKNLSRSASSEFRTFLDFHGISDQAPQVEEYFDRLEKGLITSQDAIKEFKYWHDYLLEENKGTGSSGAEIFNTTEMRQMIEMIAEISFKVSELYSNVNVNSDRQIVDYAGLKDLSTVFDTLNNHLQEIRKSLGSVDDDLEITTILSSVTKLNDSLSEVANTLERISKSNFSSNFSMTFGGNSETDKQVESYLETTLQQLQERYKRFYEKSAKYGLDDPLIGVYGSVRSLSATYSPTEFENMFNPQAISSITDMTDRIRRLVEFMNILRQAVDANRGSSDFWKDLSKSQIVSSNQLYNMNTVTKNVDKIRNTVAEGNPLEDMFKTDLTPLVNEIQTVITKLEEMMSIFRSNEAGNGIVDFANQSVQAINRLTEAFERFSKESKEALNGLNVNVLGGTIAQETPVSSDTTAVEKVKENLKEVEVQAEKTEQAVKEAVNVPSNESTLSSGKSAKDSISAIKEESKAMDTVADSAREASNAKEEFANANKKVKDSAEQSVPSLKDEGDVLDNILPSDKKFDNVLKDLDLTKSKLGEIVKITRQAHADEDGKFYESFILRDRDGSTETYGRGSNTEKGQLLRYNYVEKDVKAQEKALKTAWEEALKINKALDETNATFKEFSSLLGSTDPSSAFNQARVEIERLNQELVSGNITLTEYSKSINKLKDSSGINNVISWQKQANNAISKFQIDYGQYDGFAGMADNINRLKSEISSISSKDDLDKLKAQIKAMSGELRNMQVPKDLAKAKWGNKFYKWANENTKAVKAFSAEFKELEQQYKNIHTQGDLMDFGTKFTEFTAMAEEAGKTGLSFFDGLIKRAKSMSQSFLGMYLSLYDIVRYVRTGVDTIRELDYALVDLKKTTTMTANELNDFYFEANESAKAYGVTTAEIIDQASSWARLGYSSKEEATKMAELSSKFAAISPEMDSEQAQSGMVSIMKAWGIEVEQAEDEIISKINTLGNNFALSNADLVEGMQRSAAALAATGTTWTDAFALFTGAQEVLQNSEVAGRALRSISMRIHGYSENSEDGLMELDEELTNITGDLIDLTKTAEHTQGVSIFKEGSTTEFKSLVDYFGEINAIWDEMSQKQQNDFLQKAFGKTQAQAGAALIQNYSAVKDSLKAMEDSAGNAETEMSIVEESINFKINALKETWVGTIQELVDRGDIGKIVDGLTKLSEAIGFVVEKLGLLGTIGAGFGIFKAFQGDGKCGFKNRPHFKLNMPSVA